MRCNFFICLQLFFIFCRAQHGESSYALLESKLSDFDNNQGTELQFQIENLQFLRLRPLALNHCSEAELRQSALFSDFQILHFLAYRKEMGAFSALYELQAIPGFSPDFCKSILPFLRLNRSLDDLKMGFGNMFSQADHKIQIRFNEVLQPQVGFTKKSNPFWGDPSQLSLRYRLSYGNKMSMGLCAEKDPGEVLFKGPQAKGFDFYSSHFYVQGLRPWLKALAIGNFQASMGQGLLYYGGFGFGKSASSTQIRQEAAVLRPHTSTAEAAFLSGAGVNLVFGQNWEISTFFSKRQRDANASGAGFSSFYETGLHRNQREIDKKVGVVHQILGFTGTYRSTQFRVSTNVLQQKFNRPWVRKATNYNQYYFQGQDLWNLSVDYAKTWRSLQLFGETAWSDNGAIANVHGLMCPLGKKLDLVFALRFYPQKYQALGAAPFGEGSDGQNEKGFYLGYEQRIGQRWSFSSYLDYWRHPGPKYRVDESSQGSEGRFRLSYKQRRKWEVYWEMRLKNRQENPDKGESSTIKLAGTHWFQTRFHTGRLLKHGWEWRARLDFGTWHKGSTDAQAGYSFLGDLLYRPVDKPFSFTTRLAYHHTPSYDVRFYHYENDLLGAFSIPPYYHEGLRTYLNLRYKPWQNLVLEGRISHQILFSQPQVGSGDEATKGPQKSDIGLQASWSF
jgi:hypothetical protein